MKSKLSQEQVELLFKLRLDGLTWDQISEQIPTHTPNALRKTFYREARKEQTVQKSNAPKVLLFDIETAPMLGYVWALFDQTVGLEQIHTDWYVLSWSAKWLGAPETDVMYLDQRNAENIEDDSKILKVIWDLLDEADIVIGQNSKKFDVKKLNARFIAHGFPPPSSFRQIDTLQIAKNSFGFTSNKLQYMTDKLCTKYKKLDHAEFSGFKLWKECLAGNHKAWQEMETYNKYDVLSLEELYLKLAPWDRSINFNVYSEDYIHRCSCGSSEIVEAGFHFTNRGKYAKYRCETCGKEHRDTKNLLTKEKRSNMKV